MQLQPHIQPLLVRGAVVVCLYLVDDDEKGRNLCAANSGSGDDIPRGYCNLSSHLKSVIEKFKVSPIQTAFRINKNHCLFLIG